MKWSAARAKARKIVILGAMLCLFLSFSSLTSNANTTELFFSEYIEGSSLNKALEIYNGTGSAVDLAADNYSIEVYFNGSGAAGTTIALTGVVADGDVFVVADDGADPLILAQTDQTTTSSLFNGDDAIVLLKNGVVIDAFGQIGTDPGTQWPGGGADDTLRRADTICAGDTNATDAFDASIEWVSFPTNDFSGLGAHSANCNGGPAPVAEVLLTEIVVTPTGGEFVEIYNPGGAAIDLSDYYLTDATFAGGGTYYYNIVTGSNAGGGGFGDFLARFPDGASIGAGEYQTIAMTGSSAFFAEYGLYPTYELFDDGSNDGEQLMREGLPGSINGQGGLTNGGEVVVLFYWDGLTDLVTDVDYALWGDKDEAVDKSGVMIDGPDADPDTSAYLPDTAISSQDVIALGAHTSGNSWQREDLTEGTESTSGGNGVNGEDETSENLSATWCEYAPTPGAATVCPPPPSTDWVINEILADPDATLGDANGDGVVNTTQDEFVEIFNNSGDAKDISGWTINDGFGLRHTFPSGTTVQPFCSVVVFAGGSPSGTFGGSLIQTASSGQLGLNNGGDTVTLYDGGTPVVSYGYGSEGGNNQSLTRDPDISGPEPLVFHSTATGSGGALFSPGTLIDGSAFSGCQGVQTLKIHEVQGAGAASPVDGQTVIIEAVVVGDFQDGLSGTSGDLNGFFVQEEDADADLDAMTSEGIFVFDGSSPAVDVAVGDLVRVEGLVSEFNGLTEITAFSGVTIISSGNPLPAPTAVYLPLTAVDELEAYEGMSVVLLQSLSIVEYFDFDRYGEVVVAPDRLFQPTALFAPGSGDAAAEAAMNALSRLLVDDGRTVQNPDPAIRPDGVVFDLSNRFRGGDQISNLIGVMDYAFGAYRIQPTGVAGYTELNPRPFAPDAVGGTLRVATFNVLNYFTTLDGSGPICGPLSDQDCRGADDPDEFMRQRDKIIAALATIDADVVGLIEIENHPGDVPVADLVSGLNDVMGSGTYAYVVTGAIGTDAIRVALIYKPASVSLLGSYAVLDDPAFTDPMGYGEEMSRPALAQTFLDNSTGGVFTAVVNHLKSKGSSCGAGDDDPEQGNCNLTRTLGAQALVDWLATDPTGSGDADVLILGDLNAYDKEDPITVLLAAGYSDLVYDYQGEYAYSYVFDGQLGYLDYALANPDLLDEVSGTTVWHINADEPDILDYDTSFKQPAQDALYEPNAYRASDHDPVIVGLNVCDEIAPVFDSIIATPDSLWPANHKYVDVEVTVIVSDNFDPNPTITLLSVTSNEPDDTNGDGMTIDDIVIVDDFHFQLRAERVATGTGRIYTITYQVMDACGNFSIESVTVTVPLNQMP